MNKIEIILNGKKITTAPNTMLLSVLNKEGIDVPTLCHHKDLTPNGSCRMCMVEIEIDGKKEMVTSCNYPVRNDMEVWTESKKTIKHRKTLAEIYLGKYPNVPVIQELAKKCGAADNSKYANELTEESSEACILCGKCVRACDEFVLERILGFAGTSINRHVGMPFGDLDNHCIGCTSCAFVCPTGAIKIEDKRNNPVDDKLIRNHGMKVNGEMAQNDPTQCRMREVGTANIVEVMDKYDILPVKNYKFGRHPETYKIDSKVLKEKYFTQGFADACWRGCSMACAKAVDGFHPETGPYKGQPVIVDGPEYETSAGGSNMGIFNPNHIVEYNFYCDTYGIDTISFATTTAFVMECYEEGIIDDEITGGLDLHFGNGIQALELLHQMAKGEGFGIDVGQGILWLQNKWSKMFPEHEAFMRDIGMQAKGLEYSEYMCKESLAQQAGYTMANKGPQHDEAWLIFMDMVNNQIPTFDDKAEALYYFPLFRTWFGLLGLCKIVWNDVTPKNNSLVNSPSEAAKIPEHVENYWKYFEGMTGIALDEQKMLDQSARVHNLQRIMNLMMGYGTRKYDLPPYRAVGPVTKEEYLSREEEYYNRDLREYIGVDPETKTIEEKMALIREYREDQYNKVIDAAYEKRGWTSNAVPKISRLKELAIDLPELIDIVKNMQ